jgi:hypothetical protein
MLSADAFLLRAGGPGLDAGNGSCWAGTPECRKWLVTDTEALPVSGRMRMTEPVLGDARALRRFRAALTAAEAAPSEASVAALRQAARPLMNQLRAAYMAAGSPYDDDPAGLYRWLREVVAPRDLGAAAR